MRRGGISRAMFALALCFGLFGFATAGAAWAAVVTPKDVTGDWIGTFRGGGGGSHGDITFTFTQTDAAGNFTGTAHDVKHEVTYTLSGAYTMTGRRVLGTITVTGGSIGETDVLKGACNGKVTRMNLSFTTEAHKHVRIHLIKPGV